MKKLSDAIEPISEETAKELEEILINMEKFNSEHRKQISEFKIKMFIKSVFIEKIGQLSKKLVNYYLELEKATFITRWYWKIKFDKSKKRLEKLHESLKELEKIEL